MAGFNELKVRTLELFSRSGPIRPGEYMVRAHFYPIQAADSYLRRLTRMGLLKRRRDARGQYLYTISKWGTERLLWLKEQHAKSPEWRAASFPRMPRGKRAG